jgi:hypothetical protein
MRAMTNSTAAIALTGLVVGLALGSGSGSHAAPGEQTEQTTAVQPATPPQQAGKGDAAKPAPPPDPKQIIEGTDNDDTKAGGANDDWLFGKKGNDFLVGGGGRDVIDGGEGDDTIDGGADADILDGGPGSDTMRGAGGDDTIDGGDEDDLLDGGDGADDLDGGDGNDVLRGGAGNDVLAGGDESDSLSGGPGNDRLSGEDSTDNLLGGPGDDLLLGGEDDDGLDGEAGDDRLDGGDGNDVLRGGIGNDTLLGSSGTDTLLGAEGHDTLFGGDGVDVLNGAAGSDWLTGGPGADVTIAGEGDDLIILRAGDVPAGEVETINGGRGTDVVVLNGFARLPRMPGRGSDPGQAEVELVDPVTGGLYRLSNVERAEFTQLLTTIEEGADRPMQLVLVNPSTTVTSGRVIFSGQDGAVVRPAGPGGQTGRDDLAFSVPALGSIRLDTSVRGPVTAQVFASAPLGVVIRDGGSASAPAFRDTPITDSAIVPILEDRAAGIATGVLVSNSIAPSSVKLTLNRLDGQELSGETYVDSKEVELPPYALRTFFVRDLFPALGDFQGTMTINGDTTRAQEGGPIHVMALERGPGGAVVSSPAAAVIAQRVGGTLHMTGLSSGGGTVSSLILVNASRDGARAQGTVRFFDEAGLPWAVSVNRQSAAATVTYDIGPDGAEILAMPTGGAAQRGLARIEPTQGLVSAVLRTTSTANVSTRTVPSGAYSGAIAAARRDRASNTTTRLVLASTGSAVTLRLTLRNASGAEVPGAATEVRLPANGQVVRTIEQLFPAGPDTVDGTVTIAVEGGNVAAAAIQVEGSPGAETGLPVVPLQ